MLTGEIHLMLVFGQCRRFEKCLCWWASLSFHNTTDASPVSPAILASLKQSHQEATSVLYDEAVANDPAGSLRLSVQWWLWGPSSGTAQALGHSGAGDGGGRGEEVVAVCRYQYEQWKRGGHLHNKAINGILNHKTVKLPDPEIKRKGTWVRDRVAKRERNSWKKREDRESLHLKLHVASLSFCSLQLNYTLRRLTKHFLHNMIRIVLYRGDFRDATSQWRVISLRTSEK